MKAKEERFMGELEDETADEPTGTEPVAYPREPVEPAAEPQPAEEHQASGDQITAIQESLVLEEPEDEVVDAPLVDEPGAEPVDAPLVDEPEDALEPAPSEPASSAPQGTDVEMAAAAVAYGGAADDDSDEDGLAAAIAASHEQVGTAGTLDDISPGTTHGGPAEEVVSDTGVLYGAPWWPFLIYLGVWIAFAAVAVWQFQQLAPGTVLYETPQYMLFVFGGLALAAAGVILIVAVWLGSRVSPKRHRAGLFTSAFIKGAGFTLIGMLVWWATFMALDYLRLGRLI